MIDKLYTLEEASQLVLSGKLLVISGHESLLDQLPEGNWLGATLSRFMDVGGGTISDNELFVNDISSHVDEYSFKTYSESTITDLIHDRYENGFSYILLPLHSKVHAEFGIKAFEMDGLYTNPLVGWVAGTNSDTDDDLLPHVYVGQSSYKTNSEAAILHCKLPETKLARLEIVNVFEQGDGDEIEFLENGFEVTDCLINGVEKNFADYCLSNNINEKLPLIANFSGALINVHPLVIDAENRVVTMAASVFQGFKYRLAKQMDDFVSVFKQKIPSSDEGIISCVNCHANFEYLGLKGQTLGTLRGPYAFGEIGYVLFNQTMVNLYIDEVI